MRRAVDNGAVTDTSHPGARSDDRAQRYADAFQDETLPSLPLDRNMIRMMVDLVGERPRVLDTGCGAGQVTKMLRNWGCEAVGVDAAEKLIELARTAYPGVTCPDEFGTLLGCAGFVERVRLVCPAQPDLRYAGMPETHLILRKTGPSLGPEPLAG